MVLDVVQDDLGDEESRNNEENIDANKPAGASEAEVKKQDAHYGHSPQAVDIRAIFKVHRVGDQIWRHFITQHTITATNST
jgi:hypothetical protein